EAPAIDDPTTPQFEEKPSVVPPPLELAPVAKAAGKPMTEHGALDAQLEDMMGDAPVCDGCGHITVRNGACYKCLNCGNSMGCSGARARTSRGRRMVGLWRRAPKVCKRIFMTPSLRPLVLIVSI